MQKGKKKNRGNPFDSFIGYSISIVVSVIVVVYLGYHFIQGFGNDITTEYAVKITEDNTTEFDAYILRNETLIYSSTEGGVGYTYSDGTKVRRGTEIASIYAGASELHNSARDEIIALDKKLSLLEESSNIEGMAASDMSTLDSKIYEYYMTIRNSAEQENYANLPKRRDELLTLLNKRQLITGKVASFDTVIEEIQQERDELTASLNAISEAVTSPATGFFYSSVDGYEDIFSADAISEMTIDDFHEMINSEPRDYPSTAIGKIATDFVWYIAVETTRDELRYYDEGYDYTVNFPYNNDMRLTMNLSRIIAPDVGNQVLLIFSCHDAPEDFTFKRMQTVEIVRSSHTGYRVPISAVRQLDGKMGVYVLVGGVVDFRYINVILECDGYYLVAERDTENDPEYYTKLGLYDQVITSGKDLYVGKMIS